MGPEEFPPGPESGGGWEVTQDPFPREILVSVPAAGPNEVPRKALEGNFSEIGYSIGIDITPG